MGKKKKHTMYLDGDLVIEARNYLEKHMGLSLSGYINMLLKQFVDVAKGVPVPEKKVSEMTLQEFHDLIAYWSRIVDDEK